MGVAEPVAPVADLADLLRLDQLFGAQLQALLRIGQMLLVVFLGGDIRAGAAKAEKTAFGIELSARR